MLDAYGYEPKNTSDGRVLIKDARRRSPLKVSWSITAEDLECILDYGDRMRGRGHALGFKSGMDLRV